MFRSSSVGQRPTSSVPPGTRSQLQNGAVQRGSGGAALNKQNGRLAGRRGVHFWHDGTIMPCLPVSPSPVFPVPQPLLYYKSRSFTVRKILIKSQQKNKESTAKS